LQTTIEGSLSQTGLGYGSTNLREQLLRSLDSSREYRHAFAEEKIRSGLAAQVKTIRERREMSQSQFAKELGKSQSWISRLEDPNEPIPTIPTLLQVASKLDIGLQVRFVSFSDLLDDLTELSPESLYVPEFRSDPKLFPRKGPTSIWRGAPPQGSKAEVVDFRVGLLKGRHPDTPETIPIAREA
jgi:transcriptional regulator with XRE-family HTH domain